jgi:GNAT superfamily N-acetyltransferase
MDKKIVELSAPEELKEAFPVMKHLRFHLAEEEYLTLLEAMIEDGYRLFALKADERIVALAGIAIRTSFYSGKFVWVYDLVTDETERSKGHGEKLLKYVEGFALEEGCRAVTLSSNLERADAHRFYEKKMSYKKQGFVFRKELCKK